MAGFYPDNKYSVGRGMSPWAEAYEEKAASSDDEKWKSGGAIALKAAESLQGGSQRPSGAAPAKSGGSGTGGVLASTAAGAGTGAMVGGPWGAVIGAGVGLAGGLMSQKADEEERKRQAEIAMLQNKQQVYENMSKQEQNAFAQLMAQYGGLA